MSDSLPDALSSRNRVFGKLFGDKGYSSQPLAQQLLVEHGVWLITKLRKNMRHHLLELGDKLLLRKHGGGGSPA